VVVVDEGYVLAVLVWSEGYGAFVSEPVEELFVALDFVVEACESVDDCPGVAVCLDCVWVEFLKGVYECGFMEGFMRLSV